MSGTNTVQDNRSIQQIPNQDKPDQCQTKLGEPMAYSVCIYFGYNARTKREQSENKARTKREQNRKVNHRISGYITAIYMYILKS